MEWNGGLRGGGGGLCVVISREEAGETLNIPLDSKPLTNRTLEGLCVKVGWVQRVFGGEATGWDFYR